MPPRTRLTLEQVELLEKLYEGGVSDAPGIEFAEVLGSDTRDMSILLDHRLVALRHGWRGSLWFVLTEAGRTVASVVAGLREFGDKGGR